MTLAQAPSDAVIRVLVSVPLADGSASETLVTLGMPTKLTHPDGRREYKMVIDSSFSVTPTEMDPSGNVIMETRDGLTWEIPQGYPAALTGLLDHEPIVRDFLLTRFKEGKAFVDVGANVGAYSLRAASRGMKVYGFEPHPGNVKVLRRNAEANHLSIDLFEYALGSSEGEVKLSKMGAISRITEGDGIPVKIRTLDSFDLPAADLMKVDVEGHELEVLKGAMKTLERFHPQIVIEMHHWIGAESEAELFDILTDIGYRFEYLDRYAVGRHLIATYAA
jgi:FkbM family methyltransferase